MSTPTSSTFQPIFFSLREQIAERIRNDVLCGRLEEGERLNEIKLGEQFGVSRTPIREALQQLMHEGLLEGRPNIGVKVAARPDDAVCEFIVVIRRMVETFALRIFFSDLNETDFAHWRSILDRMRVACVGEDYKAIAETDIEFHRSIVRRARQRDLESIWTSLVGRVRSHFWETQRENYGSPMEIYEEHVRIVDVFRGGDVEAAVAFLEERIN
jgi:DNA-binding GntR family transcriptional regulator